MVCRDVYGHFVCHVETDAKHHMFQPIPTPFLPSPAPKHVVDFLVSWPVLNAIRCDIMVCRDVCVCGFVVFHIETNAKHKIFQPIPTPFRPSPAQRKEVDFSVSWYVLKHETRGGEVKSKRRRAPIFQPWKTPIPTPSGHQSLRFLSFCAIHLCRPGTVL